MGGLDNVVLVVGVGYGPATLPIGALRVGGTCRRAPAATMIFSPSSDCEATPEGGPRADSSGGMKRLSRAIAGCRTQRAIRVGMRD